MLLWRLFCAADDSDESSSEESDEEEKTVGLVGKKRKPLQQAPVDKKPRMTEEKTSNGQSKGLS